MSSRKKARTDKSADALVEPVVTVTNKQVPASILPEVLGFLHWKDILRARVNKEWVEAARKTVVPQSRSLPSYYRYLSQEPLVRTQNSVEQLDRISRALPNITALLFACPEFPMECGEDPSPQFVREPFSRIKQGVPPVNLESCLAMFSRLRCLTLRETGLNGKYPCLFQLIDLQLLEITEEMHLKFDLADLSGLSKLRYLKIQRSAVTGNAKSLRNLRTSLESIKLSYCKKIEGSIHDLADFLCLKSLVLDGVCLTGDLRKCGPNDFPALEFHDMNGHTMWVDEFRYDLSRISDPKHFMRTWRHLSTSRFRKYYGRWRLSVVSPDFYSLADQRIFGGVVYEPPFYAKFIMAGPRAGWRWQSPKSWGHEKAWAVSSCEMNWLDPEPSPSHPQYEEYLEEKAKLDSTVKIYRGLHEPPDTAKECVALIQAYLSRNEGE